MSSLNPMHIITKATTPTSRDPHEDDPTSPIGELAAKVKNFHHIHPRNRGHEQDSEAHQLYRTHRHRHRGTKHRVATIAHPTDRTPHGTGPPNPNQREDSEQKSKAVDQIAEEEGPEAEEQETLPGITAPGATGVIYCTDRAYAQGFSYDDPEWANLGQGAPEVGPIPGAADKPKTIDVESFGINVHEYAPTTGVKELRKAVADLYNLTYRQGKESQYTYENVCIVPGGRAGLTRVASVVGDVYASYQVPEYSAYDEMLSVFKRLVPIPTSLPPENGYKLDIPSLRRDIQNMGLSVIFASNPRNPTGTAIAGDELDDLVAIGREGQTVILDEFYSWYNLDAVGTPEEGKSLSASRYINDVNKDSVVLIDGLTKNWRCPGWRCCWVIGPKCLISALSQSGSFLDGGASHLIQMAALPLLDPKRVVQDRLALQKHFRMKRDHVVGRLKKMGFKIKGNGPSWTFYIWLDLSVLPPPINAGIVFMEECLREKTILVPGLFFDINPSHRRNLFTSPAHHFVRLSFGPPLEQLDKGLDGIERVIHKAKDRVGKDGNVRHLGTGLSPHIKRASVEGASEHKP